MEVRAGPGLLSQTNYTLFLADLADPSNVVIGTSRAMAAAQLACAADALRRAGVSVVTLDDTPPTYTPGTPRVLSVGERGVAFAVGLSEPGLLRYVLQSSVASPPSLGDVLSGAGCACGAARLAAPGPDAQRAPAARCSSPFRSGARR